MDVVLLATVTSSVTPTAHPASLTAYASAKPAWVSSSEAATPSASHAMATTRPFTRALPTLIPKLFRSYARVSAEIGRASCRERGWISGGTVWPRKAQDENDARH